MCGIAGVFDTRGRCALPTGVLERMNAAQLHRGPDEGGTLFDAFLRNVHDALPTRPAAVRADEPSMAM